MQRKLDNVVLSFARCLWRFEPDSYDSSILSTGRGLASLFACLSAGPGRVSWPDRLSLSPANSDVLWLPSDGATSSATCRISRDGPAHSCGVGDGGVGLPEPTQLVPRMLSPLRPGS